MEEVDPDVVKNACNQVDSVLNASIPLLTRIKFPLVWERLPGGIRIQDLHEDRYIETLEHIKTSYMVDETLCKSLEILNDDESVQTFSQLIISRMQDTQSLIALKENENRVIGCLIERVIDDINMKTASRMAIYEGSTLCKIQRLRKYILKQVNLKELYGTHRYNDIYIWSVEKEYRGNGIGKALMKAAMHQTKLFKVKVLGGIFTNNLSQSIVKSIGFSSIFELLYASWIEEEEVVVTNPGANNYSANFLIVLFDDITEEEEGKEKENEENKENNDFRKSGTSHRSVSSKGSEKKI